MAKNHNLRVTSGPVPKLLTEDMLEAFIRKSDALGGENNAKCQKYWMHMSYVPSIHIDIHLNPQSKEYYEQQMTLYKEITGHSYQTEKDEDNDFDMQSYINARTPLHDRDPSYINDHTYCMSKFMMDVSHSPKPLKILELGSGWGFCCEYLARLGHDVTGVDLNHRYIQGATKRAKKANLPIRNIQSTFDDFRTTEKFDLIFFYEAFHHAVEPHVLLKRLRNNLTKNGVFAVVAEPFLDQTHWQHWGLRLDPLAIYTIRKKGWWESGWTVNYLKSLYRQVGLKSQYISDSSSSIAHYLIGRPAAEFEPTQFDLWNKNNAGWYDENNMLVSSGNSRLEWSLPKAVKTIRLQVVNMSTRNLSITFTAPHYTKKISLKKGESTIDIPVSKSRKTEVFFIEFVAGFFSKWVPDHVFHNGDKRMISFHLSAIEYLYS